MKFISLTLLVICINCSFYYMGLQHGTVTIENSLTESYLLEKNEQLEKANKELAEACEILMKVIMELDEPKKNQPIKQDRRMEGSQT